MANNVVEYFIRAKDETGAAIGSALSKIKTLGLDTTAALAKVSESSRNIFSHISNFGQKVADSFVRTSDSTRNFAGVVGRNLMNISAGFNMASSTIRTAAGKVWEAIKLSFSFETQVNQFSVLMGSMDKAKSHMEALARFAAETPFELGEITKSSRTLNVFSGGSLGGVESMKMVGDAASAVNSPLEELSFWIGRAYSMIKGGQPFGEAAMRLQELGVITPEVRGKMEELQAAGADNIQVWQVLENRLREFEGATKLLSQSGDGLTATMQDSWNLALKAYGDGFNDVTKNGLRQMIATLDELRTDGTIAVWANTTVSALQSIASAAKMAGQAISAVWKYTGASDILSLGKGLVGGAVGLVADTASGNFGEIRQNFRENVSSGMADGFYSRKMLKWVAADGGETAARALLTSETGKAEEVKRLAVIENSKPKPAEKIETEQDRQEDKRKKEEERKRKALIPLTPEQIAYQKRIAEDMAPAQATINARKKAEADKKAEKELSEAKEKAAQKEAEDATKRADALVRKKLALEIDAQKKIAEVTTKEQSAATERVSRAKIQSEKAWGWYRNKDTLKAAIADEKANAEAEKTFSKEFSRLQSRSDWRTAKNLSLDSEAVRRVGVAREEEKLAQKALVGIEKNTADLAEKLDELISMKGGS